MNLTGAIGSPPTNDHSETNTKTGVKATEVSRIRVRASLTG